MAVESSDSSDGGSGEGDDLREFLGPEQVDHVIRQAIQACWAALPTSRRSTSEVERQIRRIVDRALRDWREDSEAFEMGVRP